MKGVSTSTDLAHRLLDEAGVATLPGVSFGRPDTELSLRLAFMDFDGATALNAMADGEALDEAFLKRHCARVVEGIENLAAWVNA